MTVNQHARGPPFCYLHLCFFPCDLSKCLITEIDFAAVFSHPCKSYGGWISGVISCWIFRDETPKREAWLRYLNTSAAPWAHLEVVPSTKMSFHLWYKPRPSHPLLTNYRDQQNSTPHPLQTCRVNQMPYFYSSLGFHSSPQAFLTRRHLARCTPLCAPPLSCRCSPQLNYSSPIYPLTAAYTASRSPPVNKYSLC